MVTEANGCSAHASTPREMSSRENNGESSLPIESLSPTGLEVATLCERAIEALFVTSPQRDPAAGDSIFAALWPRYRACRPSARDHAALAPSPELDRCLGRLVEFLRFERLAPASARAKGGARSVAEQRELELRVSQQLIERIQADPRLAEQARVIRTSAALAEKAMEEHYGARWLASLCSRPIPAHGHFSLAAGAQRTQRLLTWLGDFPYGPSYARLIEAELSLLALPAEPLLFRDRALFGVEPAVRHTLEAIRSELALWWRTATPTRSLRDGTIAVCGCGPLPLTGLMLHTETDCSVVLIDRDPESARTAARIVEELTRLTLLRPGAVTVCCADVATLRFVTPDARAEADAQTIACDVILVASLVDHDAKLRLAQRLCDEPASASIALLLRSAASLCAELAYEPVDTARLSSLALPFSGESIPEYLVFSQLDAESAARYGVTGSETRERRVTAHRSVLNTTELYRRLPLPLSYSALRAREQPAQTLSALRALRRRAP